MGFRHPNPRLVKVHRNYSVEEIARLLALHKNTVRNVRRQGLAAIDDRRPTLIVGQELTRFLQDRRRKSKQVCGPGQSPQRAVRKMETTVLDDYLTENEFIDQAKARGMRMTRRTLRKWRQKR